ncbi:MAG: hypothetical protein IJ174_02435 [Clostridia bacterium]|nr:hypothetical protein [Clostridia bacterium]
MLIAILTLTSTSFATSEEWKRDESLKGRGQADYGRSEPQYVGIIGYVVVSTSEEYDISRARDFTNEELWKVPTYIPDKQFWNQDDDVYIPHKTEVVVREQLIHHSRYGSYPGYLLVEQLDNGNQYYINVINFVTKPYWTYNDDVLLSARTGFSIAVYHQVSDYYPIDSGGKKVTLKDGDLVLILRPSGLSRYVKPNTNGIEVRMFNTLSNAYINERDLTIIN